MGGEVGLRAQVELQKSSEDQPRDDHGRFSSGGGGGTATKLETISFGGENSTKGKDALWNHLKPDGKGGYALNKQDIVYEGVGNNKIPLVMGKIQQGRDAGYKIPGVYATISTYVAKSFDTFRLFDTNNAGAPTLVASATKEHPINVVDQGLWDGFLKKGQTS
jgi:hypothetical protein